MRAGLGAILGFSWGGAGLVAVSVAWDTRLAGRGGAGVTTSAPGDSEAELEAEERLVSSGSRVRVPVIVTSDSDTKLDSDLAPCSVLVVVMVQSDTPLDVENEEILLSSSSTDLPTEIVIGNNKQPFENIFQFKNIFPFQKYLFQKCILYILTWLLAAPERASWGPEGGT